MQFAGMKHNTVSHYLGKGGGGALRSVHFCFGSVRNSCSINVFAAKALNQTKLAGFESKLVSICLLFASLPLNYIVTETQTRWGNVGTNLERKT